MCKYEVYIYDRHSTQTSEARGFFLCSSTIFILSVIFITMYMYVYLLTIPEKGDFCGANCYGYEKLHPMALGLFLPGRCTDLT